MGTTGYAKDMLKETLNADVAIVETVAHTKSALHYYKDVDVIVDVGGQDIKVIVLKNSKVKDFKLNTQCSAGNGYFLQSTAAKFGYSVAEFADVAFSAQQVPVFGYGCAVFMETDIVNFQQLGWEKHEIMAGLAKVLPKNIWLYVVSEPNLSKLGTSFILQGGTQHNLAAVKSQYDFIKSKVPNAVVRVHEHTGESGAIGAALEAIRVAGERDSRFIGIDAAKVLQFTATRDESTRCSFCKNKCLRTFIDAKMPGGQNRRYIIATCEKGAVEKMEDMKDVKARQDAVMKANPNFVDRAAKDAFRAFNPPKVSTLAEDPARAHRPQPRGLLPWRRQRPPSVAPRVSPEVQELRASIKIGMPRVLNMYTLTPLFSAYFEALGVSFRNLVYSDYTDQAMWFKGSRRGSIDQCFPSKVAVAHIHNLIFDKKQKPDIIFFPIVQTLKTDLVRTAGSAACPTVSITPEVVKAAYTKEGDVFAQHSIRFVAPSLDMSIAALFELQMYEAFKDILRITPEESKEALDTAFNVWRGFFDNLQAEARAVLERLEAEGRVGVVMLARPYHNDPGLNHEIMQEIQIRGYPVFSIDSLPQDEDILRRLFKDDIEQGRISHPKDITDVWKNCYSENTNKKIWGAKYVARHPSLVAIDLSSFKCGHDAPIYNTVERIIEATGTPYFTFHDIDENKPSGAIKLRVETIDYFLQRYQEHLQRQLNAEREVRDAVEAYKAELRQSRERSQAVAALAGMAADDGHARPFDVLRLPEASGNEHSSLNGPFDASGYDQIRAANAAHDEPQAEVMSRSAGCGSSIRDFSKAAERLARVKRSVALPLAASGHGGCGPEHHHAEGAPVELAAPAKKSPGS